MQEAVTCRTCRHARRANPKGQERHMEGYARCDRVLTPLERATWRLPDEKRVCRLWEAR